MTWKAGMISKSKLVLNKDFLLKNHFKKIYSGMISKSTLVLNKYFIINILLLV